MRFEYIYRIARLCGQIPALLGSSIFLSWVIWPNRVSMFLGLVTIVIGFFLFFIGFTALYCYARQTEKANISDRKPIERVAAILLFNIPLCAIFVSTAHVVDTHSFIVIRNDAEVAIEAFTVTDSSKQKIQIPSVAPRHTHVECTQFGGEGGVSYSFKSAHKHHAGLLSEYIGPGEVTHFELHLTKTLEIETRESTQRNSLLEFVRYCVLR